MTDQSQEATAEVADALNARLSSRRDYLRHVKDLVAERPLVVFYGCGAILDSIVETWNEYVQWPIDLCCDSDSAKWGQTFAGGVKCISPTELAEIKDRCTIFVTVGQFRPVLDQLVAAGFPSVNLIFKYDLVASEFLTEQDSRQVASNLSRVRALLADEKSREAFDAIVTRVVGDGADPNPMEAVFECDQYFPADIIHLTDDESFVDVGAFDGDTVRDFLERTGGAFRRITCFEIDPVNHARLVENVQNGDGRDRITIYDLGLWDSDQVIEFQPGKSQSTVGKGSESARVVPLDDIMGDQRVTFIKMDIEGAELRALAGARRVIEDQKPTLAVCVYHHIRDLWEIPLAMHELVPEHKLYLRHHTNLEYETVCYAVS